MEIVTDGHLILDDQFGFKEKHSTIELVHRVVDKINNTFEEKGYSAGVFLDVSQAIDGVWHQGLLYKLNTNLPAYMYTILKSCLEEKHFSVTYKNETTTLRQTKSGIPHGSVLDPILYLTCTADIRIDENILISTFAGDTAILAFNANPDEAARTLQNSVNQIEQWTKK